MFSVLEKVNFRMKSKIQNGEQTEEVRHTQGHFPHRVPGRASEPTGYLWGREAGICILIEMKAYHTFSEGHTP